MQKETRSGPQLAMPLLALLVVTLLALVTAAPLALPIGSAPAEGVSKARPGLLHEDPENLWNRLHRHFTLRTSVLGQEHGFDALDAPLWPESSYLLSGESHGKALRLLDEFLRVRGEQLISDPLKRALLQRDLWAVFDWSASRKDTYKPARVALRARLAPVLWRLALSEDQVRALPDNYRQAVASEKYASEYDPAQPEKPFLPPDLFNPRGPWVAVNSYGDPVAPGHLRTFSGRSLFLVLLRLPGGREATLEYLEKLWTFPNPWPTQTGGNPPFGRSFPLPLNPTIPQFPAGTQVALARRLVLFDADGKLIPTALTESLQIRVYREIPADLIQAILRGQDFFEFELSRTLLLAGEAGGLRLATLDGTERRIFGGHLKCRNCHAEPGIHSLRSVRRLLRPQPLISDSAPGDPRLGPLDREAFATLNWKEDRYDWGLLTALRPPPSR